MSHITINWFTTKVNVEEATLVLIPFRGGKRKGRKERRRHMK
jgi:hypothetical protein